MSTVNILETVRAGIENAEKLTTGEVTPQSLFNRYQLTLQAFGMQNVRAQVYRPGNKLQQKQENRNFSPAEITEVDFHMSTNESGKPLLSSLGTPVFCDMILKSQDGSQSLQLLWVLAEVTQTKNIVKTTIQGRDGTVKEYISDGDYMVNLRGAFSSTFGRAFPKDQVIQLRKLCQIKASLKVVSEYLLLFDVHDLVVEEFRMGQVEATPNLQRFEITCSSDVPLLLRKKQNV